MGVFMSMAYGPAYEEELRRKINRPKKMNDVAAANMAKPVGVFGQNPGANGATPTVLPPTLPAPAAASTPVVDADYRMPYMRQRPQTLPTITDPWITPADKAEYVQNRSFYGMPSATAPKPVPNQQPVAGPVAQAPVPGAPVAGPPTIPTANDVNGRRAALDQQINTILKTKVLNVPLGAPGREEAVNYVRMLKAERDAVNASVPNTPKFLDPNSAEAKQRQMLDIRRAEVQRQLAAQQQPMSGADQDRATMNAGKMELWRRGMGDAVLRDQSGELQRTAGSQFNPQQYVQSGGAYGTPGEKSINADQIRRTQEQEQLRARLAEIDREQGDLDSGKYKADYISRQGQRDAATQMSQARAAAAGDEAKRLMGQRELASQSQADDALMMRKQKEIGLEMQKAQLAKLQGEAATAGVIGQSAPILAKSQSDMARAAAGYQASGYQDRSSFLNAARDAWTNLVSPSLGTSADSKGVVRGEGWAGSAMPEKADQFSAMIVDPLENMAKTSPDEAKIIARNILAVMPYGNFVAQGVGGPGRAQMADKLNAIRARLEAIASAV